MFATKDMFMGEACVTKKDTVDGGFRVTRVCTNFPDITSPVHNVLFEYTQFVQ